MYHVCYGYSTHLTFTDHFMIFLIQNFNMLLATYIFIGVAVFVALVKDVFGTKQMYKLFVGCVFWPVVLWAKIIRVIWSALTRGT